MTRVWGIALVVAVGLLLAGESQAKTAPHRVKCRAGYVRRTVWVRERRHGRIVRTYGLVVYTRVQRCVKVKKPKAPSSPVGPGTTPTTWPTLTPPFTPIGSTPPFSASSAAGRAGKHRSADRQRHRNREPHAERVNRYLDERPDELRLPMATLQHLVGAPAPRLP